MTDVFHSYFIKAIDHSLNKNKQKINKLTLFYEGST